MYPGSRPQNRCAIVVLPAIVALSISEGAMPCRSQIEPMMSLMSSVTASLSSSSPPPSVACTMRVMTSSPWRIWELYVRPISRMAPEATLTRYTTTVVVPMSTAIP